MASDPTPSKEALAAARKWCFENGGEDRWDTSHFYELATVIEAHATKARQDEREQMANTLADKATATLDAARKLGLGAHINGGPLHGTSAFNIERVVAQTFIEAASIVSGGREDGNR